MPNPNFSGAELVERVDFSPELCMMRFRTETPLPFRPGQYATLALEDGDKLIQRPYSIASSPHEPFLEFYVELVPNGSLTPRLWDMKVGDKLLVRKKIVGAFTLDEKSGMTRHLMAATVTGVAPSISMLRLQKEELKQGKAVPHRFAIVLGGSRSWEWGIYHNELKEFEKEGWVHYTPTVSRPWDDREWRGETGRVEDVFRKYADQFEFNHTNAVGYACGHPQMIENVRGILTRSLFPKERIRDEKFFTVKDRP
jgi:ferredoxin--NADP+ reductase